MKQSHTYQHVCNTSQFWGGGENTISRRIHRALYQLPKVLKHIKD